MLPPSGLSNAVRIRKGWVPGLQIVPYQNGMVIGAQVFVLYDDGTDDIFDIPEITSVAPGVQQPSLSTRVFPQNGWIVAIQAHESGATVRNWAYVRFFVAEDASRNRVIWISQGDQIMSTYLQPGFLCPQEGPEYCFQGTILEDATAGTHVCTLTVTPGAQSQIEVIAGAIIVGNTATAQTATAVIDDGTNVLAHVLNAEASAGTTASLVYSYPSVTTATSLGGSFEEQITAVPIPVSGTMRLVLKVSTAAVSVTQTFSLIARLKGTQGLPTATLNDTVGVSVNTTNTNRIF